MYWSHLTIQAETSTSKRNHTSTCGTDTSPLTERLSFTSNSRETESKGRDIKKLPRIFFSHRFISAFPTSPSPQTPNHQPSGLACHCWVSHSPSEGPQTFFLCSASLFLSSSGESAISSERAGVTSRLTSLYRWGQGQVGSQDSSEKERPWPGYAVRSARPHPTLGLSSSWASPPNPAPSGPETLWRSAACLRGHLALHRG